MESEQQQLFFKIGTGGDSAHRSVLEYEAEGLRRLHDAAQESGIDVPMPRLVGELDTEGGFIVMNWLDMSGGGSSEVAKALGAGLAWIHGQPAKHPTFGFPLDGVCGALEQLNNCEQKQVTWVDFWCESELERSGGS
jgi:hypothetical protein